MTTPKKRIAKIMDEFGVKFDESKFKDVKAESSLAMRYRPQPQRPDAEILILQNRSADLRARVILQGLADELISVDMLAALSLHHAEVYLANRVSYTLNPPNRGEMLYAWEEEK